MQCSAPVRLTKNLDRAKYPDGLMVPCGKCLLCRIQIRKGWAIRMLHELESHKDSIFVTLTYDDFHLPENDSLCKQDLIKFYKRLRKRLGDRKIRHFSCGEYGSETKRPHYHAIIFGLSLKKEDKQFVIDSWKKCDWNPQRIKASFGLAEAKSINYVAGYIHDKLSGELLEEEYTSQGKTNVFRLLSLGIGKDFVDKNADQLTENKHVSVFGVKHNLPRYYVKRLKLDPSVFHDEAYIAECDVVANYTGLSYSRDEAYRLLKADDVRSLEDGIKKAKKQSELNARARLNLKNKKL